MNQATRPQLGQLPSFLRACIRQVHSGGRQGPTTGSKNPEGHGENIWIFTHRRSDQVIYSFTKKLDGFHDMKQLPFNGKKTKPAKLRKDYWAPLAHIQFQPGHGSVGRSVFQKLRELKHLHEVAWTNEFRYKKTAEFNDADRKKIKEQKEKGIDYRPVRSKEERGVALNAQKQNAIADMAVVLAGEGRGNKVAASETEGEKELVDVTVSWANDLDREYAEAWSKNVTHSLFERPSYTSGIVEEAPKPEVKETTS
ncbi:Large ribosomal subunit protein mL67 [Cladobotryum mycophilum]|uniref:Large ribosomal subunit protein mL67 n=1 Tax=Cladobotryum mycophilum TaxID=491253 RepID=A0ABR0SAB8_9HYPO